MKTPVELLNDSIASLQHKQQQDLLLLKAQINNITERLKPTNLLKTAGEEVIGFVKEEGDIFSKMVVLGTKEIGHKISRTIAKNRIVKFFERIFIKKSKYFG
jgi:hypothetical protein